MRLYSQKDVDKKALRGARIAVLGYGSQGRAHALNLHDSGYDVVIGVRKGESWNKAKKDGLQVLDPKDAVKGAKLVAMLVPDLTQKALYTELKDLLRAGRHPAVRAWFQRALRTDQAAQGLGRGVDRPQGSR